MLSNCDPTRASHSVKIQAVSSVAATLKRSHGVIANLITTTVVKRTLIDIYSVRNSDNYAYLSESHNMFCAVHVILHMPVIPEQVIPSAFSVYPLLQPRWKDPSVLVQT